MAESDALKKVGKNMVQVGGTWMVASEILPPGFSPGYSQHRQEERLSIGQFCKNPVCQHCLAYKQYIRWENN